MVTSSTAVLHCDDVACVVSDNEDNIRGASSTSPTCSSYLHVPLQHGKRANKFHHWETTVLPRSIMFAARILGEAAHTTTETSTTTTSTSTTCQKNITSTSTRETRERDTTSKLIGQLPQLIVVTRDLGVGAVVLVAILFGLFDDSFEYHIQTSGASITKERIRSRLVLLQQHMAGAWPPRYLMKELTRFFFGPYWSSCRDQLLRSIEGHPLPAAGAIPVPTESL